MTTENQAPEGGPDLRAAAQQAAEALEKIARHFGVRRLGESTLADSTARSEAHAAIEAIRAALAAKVQAPAWQPIETAPDDMKPHLFLVNGVAVEGFKDATGRMCVRNERHEWRAMRGKPSGWMHIPAAPQTKEPTNDR